MSDTPLQEPDATTPQASPGELLRRERDALGLSREEVAAALNLRPAVIDGLENDSYEEVPIATYRRGYLRSYANLLGLDETRVLAAYKAHFGKDDEHKVTPVHVVNKPPSRIGAWLFRLATLVVIAGLIGLTLMWWQSRGGSEPPSPNDSAPVAVDGIDGNAAITEGSAPSDDAAASSADGAQSSADATDTSSPTGSSDGPATDESTAQPDDEPDLLSTTDEASPEATSDADTAEASASEEGNGLAEGNEASSEAGDEEADSATQADPRVLNLTFNEQSWTEIFDANNQRVFVGLQEPGTTARVEGDPPFRLTVGNATGVELRWGGETVDLVERAGANNVARFTLGE
ncbi:RodZ domain-containing protein [Halomonas caseinilytica]|uniref:Cytoskeleton protein RodZ n=1 Tax=Halomonas caseinilytica TaxID=438744 RepID=A0A1M6VIN2_9GAMM|nr:RodZ domain-containing protein [Halomonas caseinilytica]SEN04832.1 cytoskeleton protein RodZ [Halomonas caseinilytica]SHK81373.1 cytoskeleton protein RodZ [Halomonas caseinilytica]